MASPKNIRYNPATNRLIIPGAASSSVSGRAAPSRSRNNSSHGGGSTSTPPIGSLPAGYGYIIDSANPPNYLIDDTGSYLIQLLG